MKHDPYGDHTGLTTNELICAVIARVDASNCLFTLLALMVEASDGLSISSQYRMAATLRDAASMIEKRSGVRDLVGLLASMPEITPTTDETRPSP
jgi:hypothetical protein